MAFFSSLRNLSIIFLLGLVSFTAFQFSSKDTRMKFKPSLKMILMDSESFPGQLPPTGFFDPLGLSDKVDDKWLKRYREAELKHGRVAML